MALTLAEQEEPLVVGTLAPHIATIAQERLVAAPQVGGGLPAHQLPVPRTHPALWPPGAQSDPSPLQP